MTYTVDWENSKVTIPTTDLTFVQSDPDIYELDVGDFWLAVRAIEASEEAMPFKRIVANTAPKSVAGITLGRVIEVINGYSIEFEDGMYSVNVVGGNNNFANVKVQNYVSVNTANSAGMTGTTQDPSFTEDDRTVHVKTNKFLGNPQEITSDSRLITYDDDGVTVIDVMYLYDINGDPITLEPGVPAIRRRTPL